MPLRVNPAYERDDDRSMTLRGRHLALVPIGVLLISALLLTLDSPRSAEAAMSSVESEVLALVNAERARNGLDPLVATETLDAAAAWLAADLSTIDGLDHTDTLGRGLRDRLSAFDYPLQSTIRENIAAGYSTPEAVVEGWINSPGHYENILASEATAAGVALYEAPGTKYRYFWVFDFGSVVDTPLPGGGSTAIVPAAEPAEITGSVPTAGIGLLVVQEQAEPGQLVASVLAAGCLSPAVWVAQNGTLVGFVAGAPSFVNASFPTSLPAGTPFMVSCG
jgi:uncharacterized protein YkwD